MHFKDAEQDKGTFMVERYNERACPTLRMGLEVCGMVICIHMGRVFMGLRVALGGHGQSGTACPALRQAERPPQGT